MEKITKGNGAHRRGFTLIELLIVVAIIAILAAIAVPNFLEAQTRAKISRCKSDLRTIATAMESYAVDERHYPLDRDWYVPAGGGEPYVGDEYTYTLLTTPIAYLVAVPEDVFPMMADGAYPRGKWYDYWGPVCRGKQWSPPVDTIWCGWGVFWFIHTQGPDNTSQVPGWKLHVEDPPPPGYLPGDGVNWMYDPTNGTTSAGDIGRSNIQCYPPE